MKLWNVMMYICRNLSIHTYRSHYHWFALIGSYAPHCRFRSANWSVFCIPLIPNSALYMHTCLTLCHPFMICHISLGHKQFNKSNHHSLSREICICNFTLTKVQGKWYNNARDVTISKCSRNYWAEFVQKWRRWMNYWTLVTQWRIYISSEDE